MAARQSTKKRASTPAKAPNDPGGKSIPDKASSTRRTEFPDGVEPAAVTQNGAGSARDIAASTSEISRESAVKASESPVVVPASAASEGSEKETTVKAGATAAHAHVAAKASRAPAPAKTNERVEQGGEQKTMKNILNRNGFKLNEYVVYPAHGVGQIVAMEEQEVAGFKLELFVINFTRDKMTLRVPTSKVTGVGMRKLSEPDAARKSLDILTGRARIKRTMWSRRAQEYEAKINSGDINAIAEVVRDLFRSDAQPEQSYSERQLYEAALDRMMREIAAVQKLTEPEALKVIEAQLMKNQKRAPKPETAEGEDPEVEEAA
jgi:CarD family transcriptional regulator